MRCWWFAVAVVTAGASAWHRSCEGLEYELLSNATPIFLFRNVTSPGLAERFQIFAAPRLLPSLQPGPADYRTSRTALFGVPDEARYEELERSILPEVPARKPILGEAAEMLSELRRVQWRMLRCAKLSRLHPLLERLVDSISEVSFESEGLHVTRYAQGEHYGLHLDDQKDENGLDNVGRVATILHYLSSPAEGGQTVFPALLPSPSLPGVSQSLEPPAACALAGAREVCPEPRCSAVVELQHGKSCAAFCAENSLACRAAWRSGDGACPGKGRQPAGKAHACNGTLPGVGRGAHGLCQCAPAAGTHRLPWAKRPPGCSKTFRRRHPKAPGSLSFCCAEDVLSIEAAQGDALLFFPRLSFLRHQEFPKHAQQLLWHGSCPVGRGEKWVAQQWLVNRTKPWRPMGRPAKPPKEWASAKREL